MSTAREWEHPTALTADGPMTSWSNTTTDEVRVPLLIPANISRTVSDDFGMRRTVTIHQIERTVVWKPGETRELPSRYDLAIHRVSCDGRHGPPCRKNTCLRPLETTKADILIGGLAPLLTRQGQKYRIDESLLPSAVGTPSMSEAGAQVPDPGESALARARARKAAR